MKEERRRNKSLKVCLEEEQDTYVYVERWVKMTTMGKFVVNDQIEIVVAMMINNPLHIAKQYEI